MAGRESRRNRRSRTPRDRGSRPETDRARQDRESKEVRIAARDKIRNDAQASINPEPPVGAETAASRIVRRLLESYGLEGLSDWALGLLADGKSQTEIELELRDQDEFQTRFKALFEREKLGLAPVSVDQIVEYERRVGELSQLYDIPRELVDAQSLMVSDVSVTELQRRYQGAQDMIDEAENNPLFAATLAEARDRYGLSAGQLRGLWLDPDNAIPMLERVESTAELLEEARRSHVDLSVDDAASLQVQGVTVDELGQRAGFLASNEDVFGGNLGTDTFSEQERLGFLAGDQAVVDKITKVSRRRQQEFGGGGGFAGSQAGISGTGVAR